MALDPGHTGSRQSVGIPEYRKLFSFKHLVLKQTAVASITIFINHVLGHFKKMGNHFQYYNITRRKNSVKHKIN